MFELMYSRMHRIKMFENESNEMNKLIFFSLTNANQEKRIFFWNFQANYFFRTWVFYSRRIANKLGDIRVRKIWEKTNHIMKKNDWTTNFLRKIIQKKKAKKVTRAKAWVFSRETFSSQLFLISGKFFFFRLFFWYHDDFFLTEIFLLIFLLISSIRRVR